MNETNDATQAAELPVPDDKAEPSPAAADTSEKSPPKREDDDVSEKVQKRISKLTGRWRQAESEVEYWRNRYQTATERREPEAPKPPAQPAKKLADFNYDEEAYQAHLEDVVAEKAAAKAEARLREKQEQERQNTTLEDSMKKFRERETSFRREVEDYDDVFESTRIDKHVAAHLRHMESGPQLVYFLGKNQEANDRVHALPHELVAIELGRLDARLALEREQAKAKSVSKAPPPPPKIEANEGATRVSTTDPESDKAMSDDEWVKAERARLERKKKRAAT